jgi:alkylated DNA repair dioxygenase AlkB
VEARDDTAVGTWLAAEPAVERLPLDDSSWVDVVRGFVPRHQEVHDALAAHKAWHPGKVFRYERWVEEPRLFASGAGPQDHPSLAEAQRWLARRYRVPFTGLSLVQYRDGRDGVGLHRDRELRWLEDTVIGVLSVGAPRSFFLKPLRGGRRDPEDLTDVLDLRPAGGDLLVMGGRCQAAWLHSVPQLRTPTRSRISVQWRWTSRRGRRDPNPPYSAPRHFGRA